MQPRSIVTNNKKVLEEKRVHWEEVLEEKRVHWERIF
jgi:hypothetical protein